MCSVFEEKGMVGICFWVLNQINDGRRATRERENMNTIKWERIPGSFGRKDIQGPEPLEQILLKIGCVREVTSHQWQEPSPHPASLFLSLRDSVFRLTLGTGPSTGAIHQGSKVLLNRHINWLVHPEGGMTVQFIPSQNLTSRQSSSFLIL